VDNDITTYLNTGLSAATTYYFRVRAKNTAGNSGFSNVANATTSSSFASSDENDMKVKESLVNGLSVSPNPVRENATISFSINKDQKVQLMVFDVKGKLISKLYDGNAEAGRKYEFEWNAGSLIPGTYIGRLVIQNEVISKNIILLR
jgi:hypothetical protein